MFPFWKCLFSGANCQFYGGVLKSHKLLEFNDIDIVLLYWLFTIRNAPPPKLTRNMKMRVSKIEISSCFWGPPILSFKMLGFSGSKIMTSHSHQFRRMYLGVLPYPETVVPPGCFHFSKLADPKLNLHTVAGTRSIKKKCTVETLKKTKNLENIVYFFSGNWIAVFRGFKLMEINFATAVFLEDDFQVFESSPFFRNPPHFQLALG